MDWLDDSAAISFGTLLKEKPMRRMIGSALVAAPFGVIAALGAHEIGVLAMAAVFAMVGITFALIWAGVCLLMGPS